MVAEKETLTKDERNSSTPIIGNLVWFSVPDIEIACEDLIRLAALAGLNEKYIPAPIRAADAFRRATSDIEGILKPGKIFVERLTVREVESTKERIVRKLIKEVRDKKDVCLSFEQIGIFVFDRESERMKVVTVTEESIGIMRKAEQLFERYRNSFVSIHVRRIIKNVLTDCRAIIVRPAGAVYFVPIACQSTLDSLCILLQALPGNSVEAYSIPITQRSLIKDKLYFHIHSRVSQIGGLEHSRLALH